MNGKIGLKMNTTAKEELQKWDKVLDEYENSIGLPKYIPDALPEEELNLYFSMDRNHIEKLSPEDCAQIAYRLSQFSFHVQRTLNRELARYNWADETIKEVIASEINNYKGYGYVEKSYQAIKNNEKANAINLIKKYAKQRIDRLSYIANNIKHLSEVTLNIQRTKVNYVSKQ
jgi:hypothetical protein